MPRRRLSSICYRFSLAIFIILICVVLLAALYDILQQLVVQDTPTRTGDIIIATATYLAIGILAFFITLSRIWTVKRTVVTIPKSYTPINSEDVRNPVHRLITLEYARCALIAYISQPKDRVLSGWGAKGTPYENVRFRTAILETEPAMMLLLKQSLDDLPGIDFSHSPYHSPFKSLYPILFNPANPILPSALSALTKRYDGILQQARYAVKEPTAADYEECISLIGALTGTLSALKQKRQAEVQQLE